ncbi:MAG: PEP-utilizing enzyme [Kofleriaceae bacterium]
MWVRALADCDASCGGKAHGLARLLAAGLRVPEGIVVEPAAFVAIAGMAAGELDALGHVLGEAAARVEAAELPVALTVELEARMAALGEVLAVRSSATIEDGEAGTAAGVFSSRTAVAPADVWPAIRAVWTSALTPLAAAYARRRDAAIAIGVIVQRFVPGERVVLYTRPPGEPAADAMVVQRGGRVERVTRGDPRFAVALAAEQAIDAAGGADLEFVLAPAGELGDAWLVQARPIVHPIEHRRVPPPPNVLAALGDGRRWTWDVAHNPDPLSPAQASLVERIEAAGIAPWSLRVCAGYLYATPRDVPAITAPGSTAELGERAAAIELRLEAVLANPVGSLAEAIDRYIAAYAIWVELGQLVAASRGTSPALAGDRPSAVEATLFAAARGELDEAAVIHRLGVLAPAWDVAVPTFAERPGLLRDAIARARVAMPDHVRIGDPSTELVRLAADLAERDDLWFARAQWLVRSAILAEAATTGISSGDAFWIPLDELGTIDPIAATRRAAGARAAAARAATWEMPICVGGERSIKSGEGRTRSSAGGDAKSIDGIALQGVGTGRQVTGRVVRFASLASAIVVGAGDVVVTRAVTPALAVIVVGCAAIVSETGGLLDHGAALARELGIPCVVGCHDAWSLLSDGMLVTVDGAAGRVTR